jgi:hypothetical protein
MNHRTQRLVEPVFTDFENRRNACVFENRSGVYIEVHEQRKRKKPRVAGILKVCEYRFLN